MTKGVVQAIYAILAGLAGEFGAPAISHMLKDPNMVQATMLMIAAVFAARAGAAPGIQQAPPPPSQPMATIDQLEEMLGRVFQQAPQPPSDPHA